MMRFKLTICIVAVCMLQAQALMAQPKTDGGWKLVWHDEFIGSGRPDPAKWAYETGFVRNYEQQYYTPENVSLQKGKMVIELRKADFPCPTYDSESTNWRHSRPQVQYTGGSVVTRGKHTFLYGRIEVCARIPVCVGAWPAIWLLGSNLPWPANGEVDMLEYYQLNGQPTILANACWAGNTDDDTQWDSSYTPLDHFTARDSNWADRFHVWSMEWDETAIRLYLDDELLNEIDLTRTLNGKARETGFNGENLVGVNPFHYPQYLLLNLALDTRVKTYDHLTFPIRYEIDYVRVYERRKN